MIGRNPTEIWRDSLEDGERRLARSPSVLAATGLLGGYHVALGLIALVITTGALATVMPESAAHVLGSLAFGVGFVFITVGRSELFTENFLIPVAAALGGRCSKRAVGRLWLITMCANFVGLAAFIGLASISGVLEPSALEAAGRLADTLTERDLLAAAASAVIAGSVITTFTWLAEAAESDLTRVVIALIVGFVLLAPSTKHAVVGFGEVLFGIVSDTTNANWLDLLRNTAIAIVGNLAGGVILVTLVRRVQSGHADDLKGTSP